MSQDVKQMLNEIGSMQYFTVIKPLDGPISFRGVVPFDMEITADNVAYIRVLAADMATASAKVNAWLKTVM